MILRGVAQAFAMDDATWRRHANPWSGWSRAATGLPLIALAVWSRVWLGWAALIPCVLVALWLWLNPRLFPAPRRFDGWMARGVLGERILVSFPDAIPKAHRRMARLLALAGLPGALVFAAGLWTLRLDWVVLGGALAALPKFWFIDRMGWLLADWRAAGRSEWEAP
ncbi:DUF6653 family protein [Ponticoccus sp. (in: a-proteobacteria)]|uniref:DUF6653 family protein n=1 Tax=Ponticoccus sp. (in: a-proteobacteria) TaxID=1925025 RepID=UPI003AB543EA